MQHGVVDRPELHPEVARAPTGSDHEEIGRPGRVQERLPGMPLDRLPPYFHPALRLGDGPQGFGQRVLRQRAVPRGVRPVVRVVGHFLAGHRQACTASSAAPLS